MWEGRRNEVFGLTGPLRPVWVDWAGFLAEGGVGVGAGHFSAGRQEMGRAGCAKTGSLTERLNPSPPPPLPPPPPPVRQPQWPCLHRHTSALQCRCIHRQPCVFPVFIPPSVPSLYTRPPVLYSHWTSLSSSTAMMWHLNHHSFTLNCEKKSVKSVYWCALCCTDKWNWNCLSTDGERKQVVKMKLVFCNNCTQAKCGPLHHQQI